MGGQLRYATLNNVPIRDHRLIVAGIFFAIGLAISGFVIVRVYLRLMKVKRVTDDPAATSAAADMYRGAGLA